MLREWPTHSEVPFLLVLPHRFRENGKPFLARATQAANL
jgi:hypothetical protein